MQTRTNPDVRSIPAAPALSTLREIDDDALYQLSPVLDISHCVDAKDKDTGPPAQTFMRMRNADAAADTDAQTSGAGR